jgi:cell wall-associated NlpC family hydrolase
MKKASFLLGLSLMLWGCGGAKKAAGRDGLPSVRVEGSAPEVVTGPASPAEAKPEPTAAELRADAIIETALSYAGVKYRYGGTTRKGMDCSGLLYVSFLEHDFPLPRSSHQLAEEGRPVALSELQRGDLLFFKTLRRGKNINHVGLVVEVDDGEVRFIHSTTSRGVIVSSLREGYWNHAFVKATRIF